MAVRKVEEKMEPNSDPCGWRIHAERCDKAMAITLTWRGNEAAKFILNSDEYNSLRKALGNHRILIEGPIHA
jgi:hypothetical protein